ncbi:IS1595 family transposase [Spirosoma utsteinense]|uniref:Transposase-like protein n=1 Tax=Spirosoma utsteinense TaxID=2585773 RepID=A0ABR6WEJ1_9BACT|nr:IS1595 family transposase [Spirosoma utsteinense]MBC3789450.1 transposase-like protein [Spirosoma utsteinense]MBC3794954.1 transposase-like protein [Spirosoma utsteinense]
MTLPQLVEAFPTELAAIEYFEIVRWGEKPRCPYCNSTYVSAPTKDHRRTCKMCARNGSVTVDTQLHNTRLPLRTWLMAFVLVTDAKKGISAKQLERNLGIHYETAWKMGHQIRALMAIENKELPPFDNIVEMDETFVGGKPRKPNNPVLMGATRTRIDGKLVQLQAEGYDFRPLKGNSAAVDVNVKRGRGSQKKTPVVGIVERDGNVIAEVMKTLTHANLKKMVQKYVDGEDAVLITDTYKGYSRFDKIIEHVQIDHSVAYSYKGVNTNTIESFWAIIKRGIMGQYHQVSVKYLPNYISEFVFKYNNRKDDDMFETLVANAMLTKVGPPKRLS